MRNAHILVLEDHPELCEEMRSILQEAGYYARAARTGADALALAQAEAFDLLIADIFLPDQSGIEVFRQIHRFCPDIAGIVITGHSTWELAAEALKAGFSGFLVKPVVPEQLLATCVSALEQEQLRRENARLRAIIPLYELSHTFMGGMPLTDLLSRIVKMAQQETRAQIVSLMLLDESEQELRIAASTGLPQDIVASERVLVGQGIAGRVARRGEPMIIAEDIPLETEIREALRKPEILSALSLPLRVRGRTIGVLNLARRRGSEPFKPGDLELAAVFAGQAAMAIDQARLFEQLKKMNAIIQRLASAADWDEAITAIIEAPLQLTSVREVGLWLAEGTVQPILVRSLGASNQAMIMPREQIVEEFHVENDLGWLTLPLRHGEKTLGALKVCFPSPQRPTEERLGLLRTLAHAAGAVIESHRLRERELGAFREMDQAVRGDLNLKQLLTRLLSEMIGALAAEGGAIFRWDAEQNRLEAWVTEHFDAGEEFARAIVHEGAARVLSAPDAERAVIGAPMLIRSHLQGAVILWRSMRLGEFTRRHVETLSTLTSATALIIRNVQLYARSEESAIIEERTRIAREIHDGLAQDLSYLVLKLGIAQKLASQGKDKELWEELSQISEQLRRDARDVRRIIFALRPLEIESAGFLPALQRLVREFGQVNEIETHFEIKGGVGHLSPKIETALFRLVQESLNNVRKHARAKNVWVELALDDLRVAVLRVRDDGGGFDLEPTLQAARERGSVGLMQMRERAERAGGQFSIETAPGKGTTIHVALPVREM